MCVGIWEGKGFKYSVKAFFHDDLQVFIEARVCCPWLVVISRDIVPVVVISASSTFTCISSLSVSTRITIVVRV